MKLKTPEELGITPEQFKNLCRLVTFCHEQVDEKMFDISVFNTGRSPTCVIGYEGRSIAYADQAVYHCGTTACFCGFGPAAGIEPKTKEDWVAYATRCFGADAFGKGFSLSIYGLLFSGAHQNSLKAAINRGAWFLMNGLPKLIAVHTWETPEDFIPDFNLIKAQL